MKISISEAIKRKQETIARWGDLEGQEVAHGFVAAHEEILDELKNFQAELTENSKNTEYLCASASGYVDMLQSKLFHTLDLLRSGNTKDVEMRLNEIHKKLKPLITLLEGIEFEP